MFEKKIQVHLCINSCSILSFIGGVSKTSSNMRTETNSDVVVDNDETHEENQEKSVTLFPIVKSLTPHEDKNNCVKRGKKLFKFFHVFKICYF